MVSAVLRGLLLAAFATAAPAASGAFSWPNTKYLIGFGDSYTYVQGTAGRQNYSFIGDYLDGNFSYTADKLLSNRIVQNQISTAEGGPNWVEFITGCGLAPGLTDPQSCAIQLWDFAFAGSDISEQYLALHHNYTVPLVNQTQQFSAYAQPVLANIVDPANALVAVWIGINDIGDSGTFTNITSFADFYSTLIDAEFAAISRDVLPYGYKNYLFMNLPPLDRTPGNVIRAAGPRPNKTMVDEWDASLNAHAQALAANNPGITAQVFDVNTFLNQVMDNPQEYEISNVTGYCKAYDQPYINEDPVYYGCEDLSEYFWFNTGHLTSHVHEILSKELVGFLNGTNDNGVRYGGSNATGTYSSGRKRSSLP